MTCPVRMKYRDALLVISFFSLLCWVYATAMQLIDMQRAYWALTWWLPWVRIDYFGETGFIVAFLCAIAWALTSESESHQ